MRVGTVRLLGLVVVGMLVLVLTTTARVSLWRAGERAIWLEAAQRSPAKPRPWLNLGRAWHLDGHLEQAANAYRAAAEVAAAPGRSPDERRIGLAYAEHNLTSLLIEQHRWAEARTMITALRIRHPRFQAAALLERAIPPEGR